MQWPRHSIKSLSSCFAAPSPRSGGFAKARMRLNEVLFCLLAYRDYALRKDGIWTTYLAMSWRFYYVSAALHE